ncbi:hypothetical protein [Streptomyces sp.]|uniref:hypothetical protein n=1 Tax=Streptomyces sp. TaxID=1931 RepID=UPI002F91F24B
MHAADAVQRAKAALIEAETCAKVSPESAEAYIAVADGWTRLAATLAEHPIAATTEVTEITHVDVLNGDASEADMYRQLSRDLHLKQRRA